MPIYGSVRNEMTQEEALEKLVNRFVDLKGEVSKVVVGQEVVVDRLLQCFLADGHVLLEGVPGLAKTLLVRTLAETLGGAYSRIQFTPDMLPGDVSGTQIFNPKEGTYSIKKGPIFGNLILADEINRAPAKVQAALLEAMQERQVTLGDETIRLEEPFLVLATQNPIEQEGTYPLPEAQMDRFMMKVSVAYPTIEEEIKIIDRMAGTRVAPSVGKVMELDEILAARDVVKQVFVDEKVKRYVVDIVFATRQPKEKGLSQLEPLIESGVSPRGSIALIKCAKAHAALAGRNYISPHDVKEVAVDVLRHRIVTTYEAEAQGRDADSIVQTVLENVEVP